MEYRATPARSGAGLTTRWVVEGRTSLVRRASMSPMLTTTAPGGGFTGRQPSSRSRISSPASSAPSSRVMALMSSCAPARIAWPSKSDGRIVKQAQDRVAARRPRPEARRVQAEMVGDGAHQPHAQRLERPKSQVDSAWKPATSAGQRLASWPTCQNSFRSAWRPPLAVSTREGRVAALPRAAGHEIAAFRPRPAGRRRPWPRRARARPAPSSSPWPSTTAKPWRSKLAPSARGEGRMAPRRDRGSSFGQVAAVERPPPDGVMAAPRQGQR